MAANKQIRFTVNETEYNDMVRVHDAAHPFDHSAVPVAYTARGLFRSGLLVHRQRLEKACRTQRRRKTKS